jgi:hypothetical protein
MRYRLMATYRGSPFEAGVGPTEGDLVLFAACPPPEDLGFEPATGHWRKQLRIDDVQAVWESRPVGMFRGARCMVLDDLGDRLHIGYLGHDGYQAEQLGYWQVDRGVFELVAPRIEVSDILEERVAYRSHAGSPVAPASTRKPGGAGSPGPAGSGRPARQDSGQYPSFTAPFDLAEDAAFARSLAPQAYLPVPDEVSGVALPEAAQQPLPLEAEALRAASAARRSYQGPELPAAAAPGEFASQQEARRAPAAEARPRRASRPRLATEELFAELAALAGIPASAYAIGDETDGALCLVRALDGFEVFHCAAGARHEVQRFSTEEAACFYLFGVLAAEALRNGSLLPAAGRVV